MKNTKRREFLRTIAAGGAALTLPGAVRADEKGSGERPNILFILSEDICPNLSCYGTPAVHTPVLDKLADDGIRYTNAYVTGPVCSATRSAMMTGMYQTSIGAHHHRTRNKKPLPVPVKPITEYFRQAGYYTCLIDNKTDLNFEVDRKTLFDGKDWAGRAAGQPFFAQLTFHETHRTFARDTENPIDPAEVEIPPIYPDHPLVRRDWADYLESIQVVDRKVGTVLKRLDDEGLADTTVVIFIGDHGRCMPRGKQFLYDGGIRIPLIVRWPSRITAGQVRDEMVSGIDISATMLKCAGIEVPAYMQGRSFLPKMRPERKYIFAARDRCDGTADRIRCVRSKEYKYIRNFHPDRPHTQLNAYKERQYPTLQLLKVYYKQGKLTPGQAQFMAPTRPKEELYDMRRDPYELNNVADDPGYRKVLEEYRVELDNWIRVTKDMGEIPENEEDFKKEYNRMLEAHAADMKKKGLPVDATPEQHLEYWEKLYADRLSSGGRR